MRDTIRRYLTGVASALDRRAIRSVVDPIGDRYSSQALNTAGLVIHGGGSALAKTGAADSYYVAKGVIVKIASGTDMPALTGLNISAGKFNVFCFFIDSAAVATVAMGIEGATIGAIQWPQFPEGKAFVGCLLVTYASAFAGGTTPLDTATTVYINAGGMGGAFDPTVLIA